MSVLPTRRHCRPHLQSVQRLYALSEITPMTPPNFKDNFNLTINLKIFNCKIQLN